MAGTGALPQAAARLWGDPARRAEIVAMHEQGIGLVEMTERVGLGALLDRDGLREIVANLTDAEVQVLRDAFLAEARHVGETAGASFPVDCVVDDPRSGVRVQAAPPGPDAVAPVARVTAV